MRERERVADSETRSERDCRASEEEISFVISCVFVLRKKESVCVRALLQETRCVCASGVRVCALGGCWKGEGERKRNLPKEEFEKEDNMFEPKVMNSRNFDAGFASQS